MKILFTLAWRNLWRNKRRTLITVASVFFAVFLAIIANSMEQGTYERMIQNLVKFSTGYIQIQDVLFEDEPSIDHTMLFDESMEALISDFAGEIEYDVPRLQNFALASTPEITRGSLIMGIDPEKESRFNNLKENLISGDFIESSDMSVMLAEGLADILQLNTGDTLVLIGLGFQGTNAAGMFPVKGIIRLRVPEMNNNTVYMPLKAAQWFYQAEDRLTSLILMPENPRNTGQLAENLRSKIDTEWYRVLTWEHMLADFLRLMQFDRGGTQVMLSILYLVIAFGIFGTILTMVMERMREFGMLISLGMKRYQLGIVCFLETVLISVVGILAGTIASLPIAFYYNRNPILLTGDMAQAMTEYGFDPVWPFSLDPQIFITQAQIVLVLSILIGLFPVYKVFRLNVIAASKL